MISYKSQFLRFGIDLAGSLVVRQGASQNKLWPNTERESCRWRCISSGSWLPWKRNLWSTLRPPTPNLRNILLMGAMQEKLLEEPLSKIIWVYTLDDSCWYPSSRQHCLFWVRNVPMLSDPVRKLGEVEPWDFVNHGKWFGVSKETRETSAFGGSRLGIPYFFWLN